MATIDNMEFILDRHKMLCISANKKDVIELSAQNTPETNIKAAIKAQPYWNAQHAEKDSPLPVNYTIMKDAINIKKNSLVPIGNVNYPSNIRIT